MSTNTIHRLIYCPHPRPGLALPDNLFHRLAEDISPLRQICGRDIQGRDEPHDLIHARRQYEHSLLNALLRHPASHRRPNGFIDRNGIVRGPGAGGRRELHRDHQPPAAHIENVRRVRSLDGIQRGKELSGTRAGLRVSGA